MRYALLYDFYEVINIPLPKNAYLYAYPQNGDISIFVDFCEIVNIDSNISIFSIPLPKNAYFYASIFSATQKYSHFHEVVKTLFTQICAKSAKSAKCAKNARF